MIISMLPTGPGAKRGTPLSQLPDGETHGDGLATIWIPEEDTLVPFLLIKHGYNEGVSLVLRKEPTIAGAWGEDRGWYTGSTIDTYLEDTYRGSLSNAISSKIATSSILAADTGNNPTRIERKIFALSQTETTGSGSEGGHLLYFDSAGRRATTQGYWLRTTSSTTTAARVNSAGAISSTRTRTETLNYYRPAFCLPSDIRVDDNNAIIP